MSRGPGPGPSRAMPQDVPDLELSKRLNDLNALGNVWHVLKNPLAKMGCATTEQMIKSAIHVWFHDHEHILAGRCVDESCIPTNLMDVLKDSDQMTAGPCAVDLEHYTRAKASQSQLCAKDRCRVENETIILSRVWWRFPLSCF
ncbi:hypothetical protein TNCV_323161 [Trichonephila clavipes]|nr:hypothetical protein TNCV_323161 [Trichonephila clavipes]